MLGAVVGGDVVEERMRSATETAKRPVNGTKEPHSSLCDSLSPSPSPGFALEGFDLSYNPESYQSILQSTTRLLPQDSPRYIHGIHSPGTLPTTQSFSSVVN